MTPYRAAFGGYLRRKSPRSRAERSACSVSTDFVAPASRRHRAAKSDLRTPMESIGLQKSEMAALRISHRLRVSARFCGCNRSPAVLSSCAQDRRFYLPSSNARMEVRIDQRKRWARITGWGNEKPDPIGLGWNHHYHSVWGTSRAGADL